jgi:hypothetical protein
LIHGTLQAGEIVARMVAEAERAGRQLGDAVSETK